MRLNKGKIYAHLFEYQQRFGGYTGKDLDKSLELWVQSHKGIKRQ
jgi:hypothetical protein